MTCTALAPTLGEGDTPLEPSRTVDGLSFKREDRNPTGSHKDRAVAFQLARAAQQGRVAVTISSSGNAALATSRAAEVWGMPALICVHPETDPAKLAAIDGATSIVLITERAINTAKLLAQTFRIPNLRPSVNDDAVIGFTTIADELAQQRRDQPFDAVVIFATSGASAVAVATRLHELTPDVQVHVVQGEGSSAIVDPLAHTELAHDAAAGRLGVRHSRRARAVMSAITATGGRGHVVSHEEVHDARRWLADTEGIDASDETAANVSVARQMVESGLRVACIVSGAPPAPRSGSEPLAVLTVDDEHDAVARLVEASPSLRAAAVAARA